MSPLDKPLLATLFSDKFAKSKKIVFHSLRTWVDTISTTRALAKDELPWLKFAEFGDDCSAKGSLRHDGNVLAITGIECDYDGETMTMSEAARLLEDAGVAALLYETPSHEDNAPRWRVICPLASERHPAERKALVARANGVLGGILKSESFALSQGFYFGAVGRKKVRTILVDGGYIDQLHDLDSKGCGAAKSNTESTRDDSRSAKHYREALKSARAGLSYDRHVEHLDEELVAYAYEPRGRSTKGERDWESALAAVEKQRSEQLAQFTEHEPEGEQRKKASSLEIFWGDDDDGSADMEPLVDGFFFQRTLASIYGRYGEGKSFAALDIALHIASGRPWMGREVAQGAVLYVAPEGYHGLKRRRTAWWKHHGLDGAPPSFALVRGSLDLQRDDGVTLNALAAAALKARAKLIVIDTLNAVFGGADENDSAAMSKARHQLERLRDLSGAAVLVIHHAGKDIERGLRGSSVLGGALDSILLVHNGRIISEPPKGKQKDCEAAPDIHFVLHSVDLPPDSKGRPVSSAVMLSGGTEVFEDHTKMTADQRAAVAILRRMDGLADILGPTTKESFRRELQRKGWGPTKTNTWRSRFRNLLEWLDREGIVEIDSNNGVQLVG